MKEVMTDISEQLDYLEPDLRALKQHVLDMMMKTDQYDTWTVKNIFKSVNHAITAMDELRSDMLIFEAKHKKYEVFA